MICTGGVLFRVEWCIRYLWCSSIILYNPTSTAFNHHTDISPFSTYKYTNRVRKPRAVDPREVTLNLTFNGSEKEVLAKLGESLGKLKHVCITAMETENIALQVFHSDGRLLSKEILGAMVDGDKIMLKEKEE